MTKKFDEARKRKKPLCPFQLVATRELCDLEVPAMSLMSC